VGKRSLGETVRRTCSIGLKFWTVDSRTPNPSVMPTSSPSLLKKRKQPKHNENTEIYSRKKARIESTILEQSRKDTGKAQKQSPFHSIQATLVISLPPSFAQNPKSGAQELLDSMLMRYVPVMYTVWPSIINAHVDTFLLYGAWSLLIPICGLPVPLQQ
jgi:hypothetical protein